MVTMSLGEEADASINGDNGTSVTIGNDSNNYSSSNNNNINVGNINNDVNDNNDADDNVEDRFENLNTKLMKRRREQLVQFYGWGLRS